MHYLALCNISFTEKNLTRSFATFLPEGRVGEEMGETDLKKFYFN